MPTIAGPCNIRIQSSAWFFNSARSVAPILAQPERDAEADQQYGAQQEEDDGLLQPGDRRDRDAHGKAKERDLHGQQADARQERAEREKREKDQTGCRGGQHLLHAGHQHEVHRDQDGNPVQRLGPDQAQLSLLAFGLRPFGDDADHPDRERQELPIADQRLVRDVGVADARNGEHQRDEVGKLLPQEAGHAGIRRGRRRAVLALLRIDLAHGPLTRDLPLLKACRRRGNPRRRT